MNSPDHAWIHIRDVQAFLHLGANPLEQEIGQNICFDLSLFIRYIHTADRLENTVDYGKVIQLIQSYLQTVEKMNLLEFLAEQILEKIGEAFPGVCKARITIHKGFVPLANFTGNVAIQAERGYQV